MKTMTRMKSLRRILRTSRRIISQREDTEDESEDHLSERIEERRRFRAWQRETPETSQDDRLRWFVSDHVFLWLKGSHVLQSFLAMCPLKDGWRDWGRPTLRFSRRCARWRCRAPPQRPVLPWLSSVRRVQPPSLRPRYRASAPCCRTAGRENSRSAPCWSAP